MISEDNYDEYAHDQALKVSREAARQDIEELIVWALNAGAHPENVRTHIESDEVSEILRNTYLRWLGN